MTELTVMTPEEIERQQVEAVFLLGGGELDDKPLTYQEGTEEHTFRYHYDGAPDYAEEFKERVLDSARFDVFTAVVWWTSPESIHIDGREFKREAFYFSSGESECPCRDCDEDPFEGKPCPLCERAEGEDHGHVYLGDGWGEAVYVCDKVEERRRVCRQHNVNVWEAPEVVCDCCGACAPSDADSIQHEDYCDDSSKTEHRAARWWWQTCVVGCLPDSDVMGPFDDETEALEDATDGLVDW